MGVPGAARDQHRERQNHGGQQGTEGASHRPRALTETAHVANGPPTEELERSAVIRPRQVVRRVGRRLISSRDGEKRFRPCLAQIQYALSAPSSPINGLAPSVL